MEQPQGKALLTLSVSGSPGLRLWAVSLQCIRGGTVSEGRLAGSAAVRISFLGWQEGGRVQRQLKQAALQEGVALKSTMFVWEKGCCFNRDEHGHSGPSHSPHKTSFKHKLQHIFNEIFKGHTQSCPSSGTNSQFLAVPELEASQDKGLHPIGLVWQPAVSCGGFSGSLLNPAVPPAPHDCVCGSMTTCRKQHYFVCTEPGTAEFHLIPSNLHVGRSREESCPASVDLQQFHSTLFQKKKKISKAI